MNSRAMGSLCNFGRCTGSVNCAEIPLTASCHCCAFPVLALRWRARPTEATAVPSSFACSDRRPCLCGVGEMFPHCQTQQLLCISCSQQATVHVRIRCKARPIWLSTPCHLAEVWSTLFAVRSETTSMHVPPEQLLRTDNPSS